MNTPLKFSIIPYLLAAACLGLPAHGATITDNFESGIGAWTQVNSGSGSFGTAAGNGSATSATVDWTGSNQTAPGAYLVNSGVAFDATQAFSGSFDFYVVEDGNYSMINFILGDVQNGITGTSSGEFLNFNLFEKTFGTRARLYGGDGAILINGDGNNNYEIFTNQWNTASFSWTPTSGTTGDLTFSWVRPTSITEPGFSLTGYTFDSNEVFFGFGSGRSPSRFDNINITGTAIPEPSVALLSGLGVLMLLRRRKA